MPLRGCLYKIRGDAAFICGPHNLIHLLKVFCLLVTTAMLCLSIPSQSFANDDDTAGWKPVKPITIIVPSNPGGGWDQTARFMQRAIQEESLVPVSIEVVNRGGAGGTIALAELVERYKGDPYKLMVTGFGVVGSALMHDSDYSLPITTPLARLTGEYQVIAVPAESPYKDLDELMAAFKADPQSISWAGGSAGGSDQIFIVQVAEALGIPADNVNYVAFTGGGEANAALMGNQVTAGITGYGEISGIVESGRVRLLAVSSETRIVNPDLPTFIEKDVDVTFQNWRGFVAPPGITPKQKTYYTNMFSKAAKSKLWRSALDANQWEDSFMVDPEFKTFLVSNKNVTAKTLASMGLGKSSEISAIGPYFFPKIIGAGLLLSGLFFVVPTLRQRASETVAANNITPDDGPKWQAFAMTAGLFLIYILALRFLGFIIATPLFIVAISWVIGSRKLVRDIIVALILTGAIYLIFENLLKVQVP